MDARLFCPLYLLPYGSLPMALSFSNLSRRSCSNFSITSPLLLFRALLLLSGTGPPACQILRVRRPEATHHTVFPELLCLAILSRKGGLSRLFARGGGVVGAYCNTPLLKSVAHVYIIYI